MIDIDIVCEYARRVYGKAWFGEERERDFRENMKPLETNFPSIEEISIAATEIASENLSGFETAIKMANWLISRL